jgi:RNA polymerase sigma-70 factor (sigma-E family)
MDDEEFDRFVRSTSPYLLRTAALLCGDADHAQDLLQTCLLRVLRRWPSARRAPSAYAHTVLVNLVRDELGRPRRRQDRHIDTEVAADTAVQSDHAARVLGRVAITAALAQLPARQREALVLRVYAELSVAEVAEITGAPTGTIKSDTHRGLARMRVLLDQSYASLEMRSGDPHDR